MWWQRSLSARRAWIEIVHSSQSMRTTGVALRKESVDRNVYCDTDSVKYLGSLSARRAWIEMQIGDSKQIVFDVALRKESVDRNVVVISTPICR